MSSLSFFITLFLLPYLVTSQRHKVEEMSRFDYCNSAVVNADPKLKENIICTNFYQHGAKFPTYCPDKPCACYFEVKGATDRANPDAGDNRGYRFSLETARKICDEYNATLPTIHDSNEMEANTLAYSKNCHKEANLIALGVTKVPGKAQVASWDDGVDPNQFAIAPANWEGGDETADDTFTVAFNNGSTYWRTLHNGELTKEKVYVFCKHELLGSRKASSGDAGTGGAATVDPHAGHEHPAGTDATVTVDPHAGHDHPAGTDATVTVDPHAGHDHPAGTDATVTVDAHAGHDHAAGADGTVTVDAHAGHDHPAGTDATVTVDAHAGHDHPAATDGTVTVDTHAGHAGAADGAAHDNGVTSADAHALQDHAGATKPILREIDNGSGKLAVCSVMTIIASFVAMFLML